MDKPSELITLQHITKAEGIKRAQCLHFSRNADGLLEAIRVFGATRLTGLINKALRQDIFDKFESGCVSRDKNISQEKENKDGD